MARSRMSPKTRSPKGDYKVKKVLNEFAAGSLRSSSGQMVRNRKQAIAIALSEQRRYNAGKYKS